MSSIEEETRPLLGVREGTKQKKSTPLPKLQIAILMLLQLSEPITSHCIFPFINQLISELDITGGDAKKVGYYAGLIESIFFATEALFVFQWSRLSDHIGRKPVLLIGIGGCCLSMICFGLSKTFITLVLSRSLVGMLNGNTGVMKSMMGELTDSTNIAQGFAWIPVSWSVGVTIGPTIGGQLAKPHDRWPNVFTHPFWIEYPYFLPCAAAALFSAFCFVITVLFLKETVKKRRPSSESGLTVPGEDEGPPPLRSVLTRPVVLSIANYGVLALVEIAFLVLMPLFLSTPIALGGLGLKPPTIGAILGTLGIADGILQALFFARLIDAWGPKRVFQLGLSMFAPLYALYPLMNLYARVHGLTWVVWMMVGVQQLLLVIMDMSFGAIFLFITSSVPDSRLLGATNGVAQVVAAVVRAIGPAASTSLFATSLERNWLGGYGVYAILIPFSVILSIVSTLLPREMWPKPGEERERAD
ncbi:MFS general substrate transporter [Dichomitus squalens]|uniref:MFS general substrate transporter n=1 Tax=Dichomitus squalens TaxID=114155 RepID=A0A4Q9MKC1_9APHY|nr:MFS general substrate transporter [Dichomitus squalens]